MMEGRKKGGFAAGVLTLLLSRGVMAQIDISRLLPEAGMPNAAIMAAEEIRNRHMGRSEMTEAQQAQLIKAYEDAGFPQHAAKLQEAADTYAREGVTNANIDKFSTEIWALGGQRQTSATAQAQTDAFNESRRQAGADVLAQSEQVYQQAMRFQTVAQDYLGRKADGTPQVYKIEGDLNPYVLWKGPDENGQPQNALFTHRDFVDLGIRLANENSADRQPGLSPEMMAVFGSMPDAQNAMMMAEPEDIQTLPKDPAQIQDPALKEALERKLAQDAAEPQASVGLGFSAPKI